MWWVNKKLKLTNGCACMHRCCVQRIAKRSRVLTEERVALLEDIGFDWTGADALS